MLDIHLRLLATWVVMAACMAQGCGGGSSIPPLTNGTVDTSFGNNGFVTLDLGPGDELSGVTVLPSGRIIAVGSTQSSDMMIAGFKPDGSPDPGFANNGDITLNPGGYDALYAVVQQPSGRLVAAGQSVGASRDFFLVGFTQDGALDPTFGTNGFVRTDVSSGNADVANAMAVLPDGRLVVAGSANNGNDDDFAVVRYTADGSLDSTFGTGGIETLMLSNWTDGINAVAVDAMGRVVAAGEYGTGPGSSAIAVARFDANGQPDPSFATNGVYTLDRGSNAAAIGVTLATSGDILVGAYTLETGTMQGLVLALDSSGAPDPAFGTGTGANAGITLLDNGTDGFQPNTVLGQPDGSLLLFGSVASGDVQVAASRVLPDGRIDTGFGNGGFFQQAVPGSTGVDAFFGAAMQANGDVVAVGWTYQADLDALLVRFTR